MVLYRNWSVIMVFCFIDRGGYWRIQFMSSLWEFTSCAPYFIWWNRCSANVSEFAISLYYRRACARERGTALIENVSCRDIMCRGKFGRMALENFSRPRNFLRKVAAVHRDVTGRIACSIFPHALLFDQHSHKLNLPWEFSHHENGKHE